jgi:dihydropyrimidinase
LRAEVGAGRYVKRPPFGAGFEANAKRVQALAPTAVVR